MNSKNDVSVYYLRLIQSKVANTMEVSDKVGPCLSSGN
jgi:hypothetical protein